MLALMGMMRTVPATSVLATFDPARTGNYTLSSGNRVVTHNASASQLAMLQGLRSSGKYWIEIELTGGANVEFHGVGIGCPLSSVPTYVGSDAYSCGILHYGSGEYDWQAAGNTGVVATGKPIANTGSVMCMLADNDNKKFYVWVKPASGAGAWITDDPNGASPTGFGYPMHTQFSPLFVTYYSGVVAKLRIPSEFTESANAPSGTTMGWYS